MTPEENERLTRMGPGTPAGEALRRYWWPVWFTEQLTDKPVPIRILREDLVLFRDGTGRHGLHLQGQGRADGAQHRLQMIPWASPSRVAVPPPPAVSLPAPVRALA